MLTIQCRIMKGMYDHYVLVFRKRQELEEGESHLK